MGTSVILLDAIHLIGRVDNNRLPALPVAQSQFLQSDPIFFRLEPIRIAKHPDQINNHREQDRTRREAEIYQLPELIANNSGQNQGKGRNQSDYP